MEEEERRSSEEAEGVETALPPRSTRVVSSILSGTPSEQERTEASLAFAATVVSIAGDLPRDKTTTMLSMGSRPHPQDRRREERGERERLRSPSEKSSRFEIRRFPSLFAARDSRSYFVTNAGIRTRYRALFVSFEVSSLLAFEALVIWGATTTYHQGLPSVSTTLADDPSKTSFFMAYVAFHALIRTFLVSYYTSDSHAFHDNWKRAEEETRTLGAIKWASFIFLIVQLVCLIQIGVVKVTENEIAHDAIFGTFVMFCVARESLLVWGRWIVHGLFERRCKENNHDHPPLVEYFGYENWRALLWFNVAVVVAIVVSAAAFVGVGRSTFYAEVHTNYVIAEHFLLRFIIFATFFHVCDLWIEPDA